MAETQHRTTAPVVGIDLGTTNSLIAFMQGDTPVVIPGEDGSPIVPSVVAFNVDADAQDTRNGFSVGNAARSVLLTNSANAVYSVKRLMGRDLTDVTPELKLFPFHLADGLQPGEVLKLNVGGLTLTPPEISAYILLQLKRNAERFFGTEVTKAVITVPAYFNDAQRQATKDAGRIAGLDVLRLVNEPTAAALAYGLDKQTTDSPNGIDRIIAVYDFGGGTFDISILKLHDGIFEVIATGGDTHLGGDDIDNLLTAVALDDIRGDLALDITQDPEAIQALRKAVIDANGILHVSAREQRSGQEAQIEVKPTYGLTDEQVETMILDSFDNAEQDITARQVIEARNEAETILTAVEKGEKSPVWQQLTFDEHAAIEAASHELKQAVRGGDYKVIRKGIEQLDHATRRFAEIMMDAAVTGALGGKHHGRRRRIPSRQPAGSHPHRSPRLRQSRSRILRPHQPNRSRRSQPRNPRQLHRRLEHLSSEYPAKVLSSRPKPNGIIVWRSGETCSLLALAHCILIGNLR